MQGVYWMCSRITWIQVDLAGSNIPPHLLCLSKASRRLLVWCLSKQEAYNEPTRGLQPTKNNQCQFSTNELCIRLKCCADNIHLLDTLLKKCLLKGVSFLLHL